MSPLDVVVDAKRRCAELLAATPGFYPLVTVMEQLLYIEAALNSVEADRAKLGQINIGLFAMREFEIRAPDFAEKLYATEEVVDLMKAGKV